MGAYEILSALGAGGMGEVYRATDTNLKRQVAIKVLPVSMAMDADRLVRFQREAEILAALNHPNIAQIFGLEKLNGTIALAMELVEGPTLADRIAQGAIPLEEALPIANQIADALEAAHEQGIIHRDLKPANIKVRPDGTLKVLDFGLAKTVGAGQVVAAGSLANSPTLTAPAAMTQMGVLLGTAAYMAPEQARGRPVGPRADIWAFGCVVFEMLAGRPAFPGETVTEILAKIIEREPDWTALPRGTPPAIRRVLRRCLEKDPQKRLAAIADARLELAEAASAVPDDADGGKSARAQSTRIALIAAVGALTIVALATTWGWVRSARDRRPAAPKRTYIAATLAINNPSLTALTDRFAVSPDGTMIAIVDEDRGLLVRHTSSLDLTPVVGAPPDAYSPVFSPDGNWIAFGTQRGLMKIPAEGGRPAQIAAGKDYFVNLSWGADDRIRYPSLLNDAIRSVPAGGGTIETISFGPRAWVSRAVGLPHGRLLVSLRLDGENEIVVREPDGTLRKLTPGWDARLTPTGHVLFSRADGATWSILAAPIDADTATLTGEPFVLARDVPVRYATPAAASASGDVFYIAGTPRADRRVVAVDRSGAERDVPAPPGAWVSQQVSPDGRRLVLTRWEGARRTIWTLTLDTGALTQITYADDTFAPHWLPDGRRIVFSQFPIGQPFRTTSIWSVLTDGRGKVEPVAAQWDAYPGSASADGRTLYYSAYQTGQAEEDILSVGLTGVPSKPAVLVATPAAEREPTPSPDGRWLAYETSTSGRAEARVAPLDDLAASVQVSTRGGSPIRWSPDSSRFYYVDDSSIAAIDIKPSGPVLTSRRVLFELPGDLRRGLDVLPNGERALMIRGGLIYSDIVVIQGGLTRDSGR